MKKFLLSPFTFFSIVMVFAFAALAQIADPVISPVTDSDFLASLASSIGGMKGATTLVIVGIIVQLLIKFMGTDYFSGLFKNLSNGWKLTIVSFLSLVGGVVGLMTTSGLTIGAALVHSATLTAYMVFGNQIYKNFIAKAAVTTTTT